MNGVPESVAVAREEVAARIRRLPDPFPPGSMPARYHAERNQQHVRDLLADRQPGFARTLERTVRDLSPRTGRGSR
jgi:hypothetical protein